MLQLGWIGLILFIGICIWLWYGNNKLQLTVIPVQHKKIPSAFDGFRIVQVSDLHNKRFGANQKRLLHKILLVHPDIIVITGDLIYSAHFKCFRKICHMRYALQFVKGAVKIAPVYYVPGNHEGRNLSYFKLRQQLLQAGACVLEKGKAEIIQANQKIVLLGSKALDNSQPAEINAKDAEQMIAEVQQTAACCKADYRILLVHHPEFFDAYDKTGAELIFAGHAHGGQIRIPGVGAVMAPGQGFWPQYTEGSYHGKHGTMIVSRGLGKSFFPFRIFNRPELVCAVLRSVPQ